MPGSLRSVLRDLVGRSRFERDMTEELQFHLERRTADLVASGLSHDEARRRARLEFGAVERYREECREARGLSTLDQLQQDLRYAIRTLRRSQTFTLAALLTLALGMGANTAIFSVVNAVVLNSLPYADSERLVWVAEESSWDNTDPVPGAHFLEWSARSRTLESIAAYVSSYVTLTGAGEPERLDALRASALFLDTLGVRPLAGRGLILEDDRPNAERVVILGHGLWQRRFGRDPGVLGRSITLDDERYTVVGVLSSDFRFFQPFELVVPLSLDPAVEHGNRQSTSVRAIARLKPDVTRSHAQSELEEIRRRYEGIKPPNMPRFDGPAHVASLHQTLLGDTKRLLFLLLGAVGLVLLIACANVANLLLSRAVAREREFAVRTALGAGKARLIRQLVTESVLLAAIGGALGLLVAHALTGALERIAAPATLGNISRVAAIQVDLRVLGFTAFVAFLAGIAFSLAPTVHLARPDVSVSLKGTAQASGVRLGGLRQALMILQVAIALVLLIAAGLLVRSMINLLKVDPGYTPQKLLTMRVTLPDARYPQRHQRQAFYEEVLQRISSLPGVESASAVNHLPLTDVTFRGWLRVPGRSGPDEGATPVAVVSPEYFRTMGIPLLAGSVFTERHNAESPRVVILSEMLARQLFPNEEAVGKQVWIPGPGTGNPTVLGVVGDVRHAGLDRDVMPQVYVPLRQQLWPAMTLVVRAAADPVQLAAGVRNEIQRIDLLLPVYEVQTMEQRLARSILPRRVNLLLLGTFALIALALAIVGVYGVIAYGVTQRTREIGIRMALGARRSDVLRLFVRQGMTLAVAGIALGLLGAWALTRLLANLLFGVSATDTVTFGAVALLLGVAALLACYVPAHRATPLDPMVVLRYE